MGEFKLELLSWNAQFRTKSAIFFVPCDLEIWQITLKNNKAPLLCCFKLCQNQLFFSLCDLEIWRMTLKINRAPLLSNIKLCVSFHNHMWIQTGVTVRKRQIWVKIDDFFCLARPFNLTDDLEKKQGTYSMLLQALCIVSNALVNSNWSYIQKRLIWVKIDDFF